MAVLPDPQLAALLDEMLRWIIKSSPINATYLGVRDYDHSLGETSDASTLQALEATRRYAARLEPYLQRTDLPTDQLLDAQLLSVQLRTGIMDSEHRQMWRRDPSQMPNAVMGATWVLMVRPVESAEENCENLLARLWASPQALKDAEESLALGENIPREWVDAALMSTEEGKALFTDAIPQYAAAFPAIAKDIASACVEVTRALETYMAFLREKVLPRANGQFAAGREYFDWMLREYYQLPYDADSLHALGIQVRDQLLARLDAAAHAIDASKSWREIIDDMDREAEGLPDPTRLKEYYRDETASLKRFLVDKQIVDIPAGELLDIVDTPPQDRATIPYAAYMPAAPFADVQLGNFFVTPVDTSLSADEQLQQLRGHLRQKAILTTLHEGYPGHHLQFTHANRIPSKIRRLFGDNAFVEGWALYCEEMMCDLGYSSDPRVRLCQLRDALWRAVRVIVDTGLHCRGMSAAEAVEQLVTVAGLEPVNAQTEVRRYTLTPTQPMTYTVGKLEILRLREDVSKARGAAFNLREFHNQLLSYGSIPVPLIRRQMLPEAAARA